METEIRVLPEYATAGLCNALALLLKPERSDTIHQKADYGWSVPLPFESGAGYTIRELLQPYTLETLRVCHMAVGQFHVPHRDRERWDGTAWVPNHTPNRWNAALIYLNEDIEGGQLVFDDFGLIVTPKIGLAVVFPATVTHHVTPVTSGVRLSLAAWGA